MVALAIPATAGITARAAAGPLPTGFVETVLASDLASVTTMAIAPDGRVFVCEQGGAVRVIANDALLPAPFASLPTVVDEEEGLLGIAFDPAFASNGWVYVLYTNLSGANQLDRLTAAGDVALPGSRVTIVTFEQHQSDFHVGGAIHFGADGNLYVAIGDNATPSNAQSLSNTFGKILRFHPDGSIPTDNPFYASTSGLERAIFALGFRNPFTFAFQPGTGRLFVNDVGQETIEEIDDVMAGGNYGWPFHEGPGGAPAYSDPLHWYSHNDGCAITGGTFFNPAASNWPAEYVGRYFFTDYCSRDLRFIDPADPAAFTVFGTVLDYVPVDVRTGPDGNLYYLMRGGGTTSGRVVRVSYTGSAAPAVSLDPQSLTVPNGAIASFSVSATGTAPLAFTWLRDGAPVMDAADAPSYTLDPAQLADSGAVFRCVVSNAFGSDTSAAATLTVLDSGAPTATILTPIPGSRFRGGTLLEFSGTADDPEDGALPDSAYTWWIDLHHDAHTHPALPPTRGITSGSFAIDARTHTETDIFYRVNLRVRDSSGLAALVTRDVHPDTVHLAIESFPPGIPLSLDGLASTGAQEFPSTIGVIRTLGAPAQADFAGVTWRFTGWSDAGADTHEVATPETATTFVATYAPLSPGLETLVDWQGDRTPADAILRGFHTPIELNVLLEGDDLGARWHIPYSDSEPLTPEGAPPGPSVTFYGGLLLEGYYGFLAFHEAEVWDRGAADALHSGGPTGSRGWDLRYWKREDFLAGSAAAPVVFGPGASLELLGYAGQFGLAASNSGLVRFVVRDGTQFWISHDAGGPSPNPAADFVLNDPDGALWAPYAPAAPHEIRFDADSATFVPHTFTDVTAIGYLHSNENVPPPATNARAGFSVMRVHATGRLLGATAAPPAAATTMRVGLWRSIAPNPAAGAATFAFALPKRAPARLRLYDVTGRLVATPVEGTLEAGEHRVRWTAHGRAPGVYVAVIEAMDRVETRRFVLVR